MAASAVSRSRPPQSRRRRNRRRRKRIRWPLILLAVLLVLIGGGLLAYPAVSQWYNARDQSNVITDYSDHVEEMDDSEIEQELERARVYNEDLIRVVSMADPFHDPGATEREEYSGYGDLLNLTPAGVMGYIEIPSINVYLPIYHGVGKAELAMGVGHLPETSLPVGGPSTHAVLAGHSGMSNARLFTDLPDLVKGDVFYIHVYNRTLFYTVDQIKTVVPTDTRDLVIVADQDYVTLVTCTPYGVNSHRLLVRGTRTE